MYVVFLFIETKSTEKVIQSTTNTGKKNPHNYYQTFPNSKQSDDDTFIEPAEPIKVLDE